ncbi:FTR1 family iron permease [Campylobacter corcagiensis]|uniref:FTR1 family iron permease n=1 Tax=Campylobacter corcagiensis TaxID=1448857 RepID=A0A7M1LEZ5_9BACT|nr:FTR1 family protein [Campylobacter corcagiensis]QKF64696.1 ferrirhodotorulic acid ABC transporter, inner membrane protein [Campylobacter corcagiensis]QOQ87139.1 FTR1 family iron permease [Campylobacter corcagiensis]
MRVFLTIFIFLTSLCFARVDDFYKESNIIKDLINQSVEVYESGDNLKAKKLIEDAYFQHFENMEGAIGRNIGRRAITMERKFTNLRRYYKENADINKIKALIDGLYFDLDEVVPIIQDGFKLKAEASDLDYDKEAAIKSSIEANAKREAAADDIFAAILGTSNKTDENKSETLYKTATKNETLNLNETENLNQAENKTTNLNATDIIAPESSDEVVANLQAASALNPKLQALHDEFSLKLDEAAISFRNKDLTKTKSLINGALYDDYRNTKLEIAISKFTKPKLDQQIQQALRSAVTSLDDANLTEHDIREKFENIKNDLFDAMLLIPEENIKDIKFAGFDDTELDRAKDYSKVANEIKLATDNILKNYEKQPKEALIDELQSTYLDIFEASGMENKIGAVDSALKLEIESVFTHGVALIKSGASKNELKANFDKLNELLVGSLDKVNNSSPLFLFLAAFGILLREGLEALIIVVAIVSYLIQSGNKNRLNIAYSALFTGVFLSFVAAFLIYYFFRAYAGQFRELLEGITFLIAVVLLIYVGFWMLHKARDQKWAHTLKTGAMDAISKNSAKTLWITVFLAVFREGAETVLFYQALLFDAKTSADFSAVFVGLGVALVVLVVLYFLLKAGAVRIPIKLFFKITSYIIFYMCFVFTGKGVAELIEGKIISPTLIGYEFKPITWLGLYPYYETLLPQILVLTILIIGILITNKLQKKETK